MKKKLSLLSSLTSIVFASLSPLACTNKNKDKDKNPPAVSQPDQEPVAPPIDDIDENSYKSQPHMLHYYAKVTNLGCLENDNNETIITAFLEKNNLELKHKNIIDINKKDTDNRYAIIATARSGPFLESTVRVTFSTQEQQQGLLTNMIKNTDVIANRHVEYDSFMFIPTVATGVKNNDIIAAINDANGLSLDAEDYEITILKGKNNNSNPNRDQPFTATITAKKDQNNTIDINVNKKIDLKNAFFNQNLDNIYLWDRDIELIKNIGKMGIQKALGKKDSKARVLFTRMIGSITEFIGSANPKWEWIADIWADLVMNGGVEENIDVKDNKMIIDSAKFKNSPFANFFTGKITFTYKINPDTRLPITDAFKKYDLTDVNLGVEPSADAIVNALLKLNPKLTDKYDISEIKHYLKVDEINHEGRTAVISWQPGSTLFLGHHPGIWFISKDDNLQAAVAGKTESEKATITEKFDDDPHYNTKISIKW